MKRENSYGFRVDEHTTRFSGPPSTMSQRLRDGDIGSAQRAALDVCDDPAQLQRWLAQVVTAVDAAELFRPSH